MSKSNSKSVLSFICICLLVTGCFISGIPDPDSVSYDSTNFNRLAKKVIDQDQVWQMDDFTRDVKKINGIYIKLYDDIKKIDDSVNIYINTITDSLKIDKTNLEDLRKELEKTQLREFYKSNDSILFIVDGFLSHKWGYFYTAKPSKIDTMPFRFLNNYVRYHSYVNTNWRKVNIGF